MQFSPLLLVFLFWKLLLNFFYILGSLYVCDTKKILVGTHFCDHYSWFCPSCFSSLTLRTHFILSHSHPDLIFSPKCVHNIMVSCGQEMVVDMMGRFAGHVLAVLWPYMHVILGAFSTPKVPTSFICSCFAIMLRNRFLVLMACSVAIWTTRYVFFVPTIHHSILLIIGGSCHFLLQSTDRP